MSPANLPELPSVVDPRLANLLEGMREACQAVEHIASDTHHQADLAMRSFRQIARSLKQVAQPPAERR